MLRCRERVACETLARCQPGAASEKDHLLLHRHRLRVTDRRSQAADEGDCLGPSVCVSAGRLLSGHQESQHAHGEAWGAPRWE